MWLKVSLFVLILILLAGGAFAYQTYTTLNSRIGTLEKKTAPARPAVQYTPPAPNPDPWGLQQQQQELQRQRDLQQLRDDFSRQIEEERRRQEQERNLQQMLSPRNR